MPLPSLIATLLLLACAAWAAAQQTTPAATQPAATAPADATTPKGTLKLLSSAMERGDEAAMRRLMLAEGPIEQKMVSAQIGQAKAFAQFRQALVRTFGQEALDNLIGRAPAAGERDAVFDAAPEVIQGSRATITVEQDVYELKQIDGQWRLSLTGMAKSIEPAVLEESLREMTLRSEVMSEIAAEIAEGKYQSTDEVGQALQGKLMAALMRQAATTHPATTQPDAK